MVRNRSMDEGSKYSLKGFMESMWSRDEKTLERLGEKITKDASGEYIYQGRRVILRDSAINGGVSLGAGPREAIVVDDRTDQLLALEYSKLKRVLEQTDDAKGIEVLRTVFNFVSEKMPNASSRVPKVLSDNGVGDDEKIELSRFLGGGVCRHQALFSAYLIEKLILGKKLSGTVSVDRSKRPDLGSHTWVRFTSDQKEIYILDTTLHFFGAINLGERDQEASWMYARPEDLDEKGNIKELKKGWVTEFLHRLRRN